MTSIAKAVLAACAVGLAAPALAQVPEPAVLRGGGETRETGVLVLRGTPSALPELRREPDSMRLVTAGQRLWLVEPASGRLAACTLERTANVGERRIACAAR